MNKTMQAKPETSSSDDKRKFIGHVLAAVSAKLDARRIGAGPLAELRRMAWGEFPPSFWRFYLVNVPAVWREPQDHGDDRIDLAWASLLRAMAEASPDPHKPDKRRTFGAVLAETKYAEARFVHFLRAEDRDLARETRTAAAWLARAGQKANWREPAELILGRIGHIRRIGGSDVKISHPDTVTHRLARDYFRVQAAAS